MDGINTCYLHVHIVLAISNGRTHIVAGTYLVDMILKLRFCSLQIVFVQLDIASFAQSLIGFRSGTSIRLHRVGKVVTHHIHIGIDESVTSTQQYDDHEDAPRHSKTCERSTELISPCRLP